VSAALHVGVDMTPDMLAKAREGAREKGFLPPRVEFRLGEIENLPAGDNTVVGLHSC
jgi:arsenite methyltransferase